MHPLKLRTKYTFELFKKTDDKLSMQSEAGFVELV